MLHLVPKVSHPATQSGMAGDMIFFTSGIKFFGTQSYHYINICPGPKLGAPDILPTSAVYGTAVLGYRCMYNGSYFERGSFQQLLHSDKLGIIRMQQNHSQFCSAFPRITLTVMLSKIVRIPGRWGTSHMHLISELFFCHFTALLVFLLHHLGINSILAFIYISF